MNLEEIKQEVSRMDPNLNGEGFQAAVVLLSGLQVGADAKKVAKFTGYAPDLVEAFSLRLHRSGVWTNGKTACEWFDKDNGGIAFWMDVCVAQGLMQRATAKKKIRSQKIGTR